MKLFAKLFSFFLASFCFFPRIVDAHLIGGETGLISGFAHPVFGFDHLIAMVAVGILGSQIGGRALWKVPVTFVSFMVLGGFWAISGHSMHLAELGIAFSVLFFGILMVFPQKISLVFAIIFVAVFAIFHGYAHGAEIPSIAHPALYAFGFVVSTTFLHILGVTIGHYAKKTEEAREWLRYVGAGTAAMGGYFLLGF